MTLRLMFATASSDMSLAMILSTPSISFQNRMARSPDAESASRMKSPEQIGKIYYING